MSEINFKVIIEEEINFTKNNNKTWNIGIEAEIDCKKINKYKEIPIDILELIKSKNMNGGLDIFTCSCGIADCGNVESVLVKHKNNKIFWNFDKSDFEFNAEQYHIKINLLIKDFLDSYEFLESEGVEINTYPFAFQELNSGEDIVSKVKSLKKFEDEQKLKSQLSKFLYEKYEINEFEIWIKDKNILAIIDDISYNKLVKKEFNSVKELKKYIKENIDPFLINELRELKKNRY